MVQRWRGFVMVLTSGALWGMLIGGVVLALINHPWTATGIRWSWESVLEIVFVVVFGTLVAFYLFVDSLRYVSSTEASLLSIIEPLVAVLVAVIWLKVSFGVYEGVGGVFILIAVVLLSFTKATRARTDKVE